MITVIRQENLNQIHNPELADYAQIYLKINNNFLKQVEELGLGIGPQDTSQQLEDISTRLVNKGVILRNQGKSFYANRISPACEACQTGVGSATFFISLKCHRNCYYCFNPNQEEYKYFVSNKRDVVQELQEIRASGQKVKDLALTGGEPLLFKEEAVAFFCFARENFPKSYTRLYTSGDHVNVEILKQLREAGLDEIRFSIRMHDLEKGEHSVFERIAVAQDFIPHVMVEMPVLPGTLETMKGVLLELDRMGIFGINLLEFCFPFGNADEFRRRGFRIKGQPYRVLYNYWYAGGLPIAGSEQVCLELLEFTRDQGLSLGVHYCSLENKHTGQIYQQNKRQPLPKQAAFSHKDFFIKTAKVFGEDISPVLRLFQKLDYHDYNVNETYHYLEFHVNKVKALAKLDPEIGISYSIWEDRGGEPVLRELKVDYTTASKFDPYKDI
jgi:uncharacterized protein